MPDLTALTNAVQVGLGHYLGLSAILFSIGVLGVVFRRNALVMFMSVELMLTAVNLSLISFSRYMDDMHGHVFVLFVLAVAAAEAGVGLAILVEIFRKRDTVDVDELAVASNVLSTVVVLLRTVPVAFFISTSALSIVNSPGTESESVTLSDVLTPVNE